MDSLPHSTDEKELLFLLQQSNTAAFTSIYNLYWQRCFYTAAKKLNDLSEAEEVVQDIFLDLWKRREDLNITGNLSCYLAVSVKYKVINALAKKHRQSEYLSHCAAVSNAGDLSTTDKLQAADLEQQLRLETLKLPEKCRLVFQLSRDHGYSQKQIAEQLNISEKTVESHISRALRTLRTSLSHLLTML